MSLDGAVPASAETAGTEVLPATWTGSTTADSLTLPEKLPFLDGRSAGALVRSAGF
jgi:hypothetical protein